MDTFMWNDLSPQRDNRRIPQGMFCLIAEAMDTPQLMKECIRAA